MQGRKLESAVPAGREGEEELSASKRDQRILPGQEQRAKCRSAVVRGELKCWYMGGRQTTCLVDQGVRNGRAVDTYPCEQNRILAHP
jgi:hypothetical protein